MFDWVTWSIWLVGFAILVVWIVVPYREFRKILEKHKSMRREKNE
jgi:hypothetical protein